MLKIRKKTVAFVIVQALLIVFITANLAFVWVNSSKESTKSDKASNSIAEPLAKKTVKNYDKLPQKEQAKHLKKINAKVRTIAHFAEFLTLGMLFCLLISVLFEFKSDRFKRSLFICVCLALCLTLICAVTDEVHQIFVKGRTFQFTDILVDMCGAVCGCLIALVPLLIFKRKLIK